MRHAATILAAATILLAPSCVTKPRLSPPMPARRGCIQPRFEQPTVGLTYIPVMGLEVHAESDRRNGGAQVDLDLHTGDGVQLYYGTDNFQFSYMRTDHTQRTSRDRVASNVLMLELVVGERNSFMSLYPDDPEQEMDDAYWDTYDKAPTYHHYLGLGVGASMIDYEGSTDDHFSTVFQVKVGVDIHPTRHFSFGVSTGYMLHAYPGETVAQGAYLGLEGLISF